MVSSVTSVGTLEDFFGQETQTAASGFSFVRSAGGPIVEILARLDVAVAEAAWAEMKERLSVFNTPTGWEGPNELLLTAGRRPKEMP